MTVPTSIQQRRRISRRTSSSSSSSCWLVCLVLSGCLYVVLASSKSATTSSRLLDLSYLPNLPPQKLAEAIQDHIQSDSSSSSSDNDSLLSIDLSHSSLRDAGFLRVLNVLLPPTTTMSITPNDKEELNNETTDEMETATSSKTTTQPKQRIHLCCRMNDLTPLSAKALLERILQQQQLQPPASSATPNSLPSSIVVSSLDLGWNHLSTDELGGDDNYHPLLEQWLQQKQAHNKVQQLSLERCGLTPTTCRALAKGLLGRQQPQEQDNDTNDPPLQLHLARNPWIGDAGTAALAAALRTWAMQQNDDSNDKTNDNDQQQNVDQEDNQVEETPTSSSSFVNRICLDTLDLSGCDISDAGAQALALALEEVTDGCMAVRNLNLSHNQITQEGATALGRALILASSRNAIETLDLSDNPIGDRGATSLAAAMEQGKIPNLILRSCQIHADGASAMGTALCTLTTMTKSKLLQKCGLFASLGKDGTAKLSIDLSGNPLGVLRGKSKSSSGGKYSASRLKSTATATATSYMNRIKQGIKDSGVGDFLSGSTNGADSDDEEAQPNEDDDNDDNNEDSEESKKRCGAKALASSFLGPEEKNDDETGEPENMTTDTGLKASNDDSSIPKLKIHLGLRHCFFDHSAADALAAILVEAKDERNLDMELDVALNPVLEEDMVDALQGDEMQEVQLAEMAERYMDMLQAIRESKRRAAEARARARAQLKAEEEEEASAWYGDDNDEYDDDGDFEFPDHGRTRQSMSWEQEDLNDDEDYDDEYDNAWDTEEEDF